MSLNNTTRHNILVASIGLLTVTGLIGTIIFAVQSNDRGREAEAMVEEAIGRVADGNFTEGLSLLEQAEEKQKGICSQRINNYYAFSSVEDDPLLSKMTDEQKLRRLDGINRLRRDPSSGFNEKLNLLMDMKRADDAAKLISQFSPLNGDNYNNFLRPDDEPMQEVRIAELFVSQGKKQEAAKLLERPVALFPWNKETKRVATSVYESLKLQDKIKAMEKNVLKDDEIDIFFGIESSDDGRKKTIASLDSLLKRHPDCVAALLLRSQLYLSNGQKPSALKDATRVVSLAPSIADAYQARGAAYSALEKYNEAFADFTAALKYLPGSVALMDERCEAAAHAGKSAEVEAERKQILELRPESIQQYRSEISDLQADGKYAEALKLVDIAIPVAVRHHKAETIINNYSYDGMPSEANELKRRKADILENLKRYDDALSVLKELTKDEPKEKGNFDQLTTVYLDLKKPKEALTALDKAIELEGNPIQISTSDLLSNLIDVKTIKDKLPEGASVKMEALERLRTREKIDQQLHDKTGLLNDRRERLRLMKLALAKDTINWDYLEATELAIIVDDRAAAMEIVSRLRKEKPACYDGFDSFANRLSSYQVPDPQLAIDVLAQLKPPGEYSRATPEITEATKKFQEQLAKVKTDS